jgi:hypothetical protein
MATKRKLDSDNRAVRFIERWKRGMNATLVFCAVCLVPSLIASYAGSELFAWMGGSEWSQVVAGALGLAIIGPWLIGSRGVLALIGDLAGARD